MKHIFTFLALAFVAFFGVHMAQAAEFNNHPLDCPNVSVKKVGVSNTGCWDTTLSNIQPGDQIVVGLYFHNNSYDESMYDTAFYLSNPQGGTGSSYDFYGKITPSSSQTKEGSARVNFTQKVKLVYVETRIYFNGVGQDGTWADDSGKIFSGNQMVDFIPRKCQGCDEFQYQGAVKAFFRVEGVNDTPPQTTNPPSVTDCTAARNRYLDDNRDVKGAGADPLNHYRTYGYKEGRTWRSDLCNYTPPTQPPVNNSGSFKIRNNAPTDGQVFTYTNNNGGTSTIGVGGGETTVCLYGLSNSVVKIAGVASATYSIISCDSAPVNPPYVPPTQPPYVPPTENPSNPPTVTDCTAARNRYLEDNRDVRGSGVDPLNHYRTFGYKEGRTWRSDLCNYTPPPTPPTITPAQTNSGSFKIRNNAQNDGQVFTYTNNAGTSNTIGVNGGETTVCLYGLSSSVTKIAGVASATYTILSCDAVPYVPPVTPPVTPPPTNDGYHKPQWDTNGYPRVVCNSNGTATVTIKGISTGRTFEFYNPISRRYETSTGDNAITWYNIPSMADAYSTWIHEVGAPDSENYKTSGFFAVRCGVTPTPDNDTISWITNGYPKVVCNGNNTANVTVKAYTSSGKLIEFYSDVTGTWQDANIGSDSFIVYNVPVTSNPDKYFKARIKSNPSVMISGSAGVVCNQAPTAYAPKVITLDPTDVARDNARLNGNLTSTGGLPTDVFFTFGFRHGSVCQDSDLGFITPPKLDVATGAFSNYISDLPPNTWYCYEAVAVNSEGEDYGGIKTFKTPTTDVPPVTSAIRVETVSATEITLQSARLRGDVLETGKSSYLQTWFEFGTSYNEVENGNARKEYVSGDYSRGSSIYKYVYGLSRGTRYYFKACGSNGNGEKDCGDTLTFSTSGDNLEIRVDTENEDSVSYNSARLNGRVRETGKSTRLKTWFEYGTSENSVANGSGTRLYLNDYYGYSQGQSFSQVVTGLSNNTRYYYRACGDNPEGERDCGEIENFTTLSNGRNPDPIKQTALVTTLAPTRVREYSARLNGSYNSRDCSTELWFEYGKTTSLGKVVAIGNKAANTRGTVTADVSDLVPNTTYYYRIVGSNCGGISRGSIKRFKTPRYIIDEDVPTKKPKPPVVKKPVVTVVEVKEDVKVASTSLCSPDLDLRIEDNRDIIMNREDFEYVITYMNLAGANTIRNVEMQIEIPPQLEYVSSSRGTYNKDSHSIFVTIGDLSPAQQDSVRVVVRAKKGLTRGELIIASATASFVSPVTGTNDSSTDFDSDEYDPESSDDSSSRIIGSSNSGGGFMPTSLVGWLSLIFLIFLFIAALRWLWFGKKGNDYSSAYGPYGIAPSATPVAPVANPNQPPQQPMYVPFNPNQR